MSDFRIRLARAEDADAIARVIVAAYAPWRARLSDLPDVAGGIDAAIAGGGVSVAETTTGIAGMIETAQADATVQVVNLAVDPAAAGAGIGTALMRHAEAAARGAGADGMRLATHRGMTGTLAFYRRLGWSETGGDGNRVFLTLLLRPE